MRTRWRRSGRRSDEQVAWREAWAIEQDRCDRVILHVRWQNGPIAALLVLGIGNLAYTLLR